MISYITIQHIVTLLKHGHGALSIRCPYTALRYPARISCVGDKNGRARKIVSSFSALI